MAAGSLAGNAGGTVVTAGSKTTQHVAVNPSLAAHAWSFVKNDYGGSLQNPYKYYRRGSRNQKKYRAFMRSNPNFPTYKKRK